MEPKLLSSIENDFIRDYSKRIQALQNLEDELKTEQKVYTNIPLDYCVIYKLYNLSVIFHPLSIQYSKVYEKPLWDKVVDTFQKIVEYELTKNHNCRH
jgi:hypothetical protein